MQTIEEYLSELKFAMQGNDSAIVQDALADAETHLQDALSATREASPELTESEALQKAVEQYGTPAETAAAYAEVERRTSPILRPQRKPQSWWRRFFSVYDDPYAWGTLLYMLISLVTGTFYFSWVFIGLSISLTFSLFIFGIPLAILFLLSVRGLALLEGRLVEALLGERMPRRPLFSNPQMKWQERFKVLLTDRHIWLAMLYMILQQLLGLLYFSLVVILFSLSISFMAAPVVQMVMHQSIIMVGTQRVLLPVWSFPLMILAGFLLWTAFMHLGRGIGRRHGRFAKAMLVME